MRYFKKCINLIIFPVVKSVKYIYTETVLSAFEASVEIMAIEFGLGFRHVILIYAKLTKFTEQTAEIFMIFRSNELLLDSSLPQSHTELMFS